MSVSKALRNGRIVDGVEREFRNGKEIYLLDPVLCDAQWIANARRPGVVKRTENDPPMPVGRPSPEYSDAMRILRQDKAERMAAKKAQREADKLNKAPGDSMVVPSEYGRKSPEKPKDDGRKKNGKPKRSDSADGPIFDPEKMTVGMRKNLADMLKAEAQAEREQIALKKDKLELVEVEKFEDEYSSMVAKARDMFLQLPKTFRVSHMDAPPHYAEWLEDRIESILKNLSGVCLESDA